MTKTAFEYIGKNGTYIKTEVLHKAPKGNYKKDIIKISLKSHPTPNSITTETFARVMTPYEAIIIANALLNAVMIDNETRRRLR